uniref:Uncharacterized protein n=1 Tax=Cacopsylla melanoneura TaxID=428564 RepID=A0A8D8QQG5_9HEMI
MRYILKCLQLLGSVLQRIFSLVCKKPCYPRFSQQYTLYIYMICKHKGRVYHGNSILNIFPCKKVQKKTKTSNIKIKGLKTRKNKYKNNISGLTKKYLYVLNFSPFFNEKKKKEKGDRRGGWGLGDQMKIY